MLNAKNQFLTNQNGEEQEWHRYSEERPPMAKSLEPDAKIHKPRTRRQESDAKSQRSRARHQEPDAKIQRPRTRRQESDAKSQRSRARHQEPDAKSQMPKLHGKSEKSQIQMGHPWNQHLTPKLSLLMIF